MKLNLEITLITRHFNHLHCLYLWIKGFALSIGVNTITVAELNGILNTTSIAELTNHTDSYVVRPVFREVNHVTNYWSKLGHHLPLNLQLLDSPLLIARHLLPMIIEEFIFLAL